MRYTAIIYKQNHPGSGEAWLFDNSTTPRTPFLALYQENISTEYFSKFLENQGYEVGEWRDTEKTKEAFVTKADNKVTV